MVVSTRIAGSCHSNCWELTLKLLGVGTQIAGSYVPSNTAITVAVLCFIGNNLSSSYYLTLINPSMPSGNFSYRFKQCYSYESTKFK